MDWLRDHPRLIRYVVMVVLSLAAIAALSVVAPGLIGDDLPPFLVIIVGAYLVGVAVEAYFRQRWSMGP